MRLGVVATGLLALALQPGTRAPSARVDPTAVTVRVLTFNIRHGEGLDRRIDLERVAAVIRAADPDLVALQEVDQGTGRAGGVRQLDVLAAALGMHGVFGKAMDFDGGAYGVAVLSRWPILDHQNRPLPSTPDHEPRTALTVSVRVGDSGPPIQFTSTHLDESRTPSDRPEQVARLNAHLATGPAVVGILGGDFNTRGEVDVLESLDAHWTNTAAWFPVPPAGDGGPPRRRRGPRGDFVLFRPVTAWRVVEAGAIDGGGASDHQPVLAVLEWAGPT